MAKSLNGRQMRTTADTLFALKPARALVYKAVTQIENGKDSRATIAEVKRELRKAGALDAAASRFLDLLAVPPR
ncbi:hypothetical protein ATK36_0484 [Amycolatopsis sulphurea]|uniref:Uncharacterized protein n=1 Tax=Amycolatopsis sulphurea TaxID=76022 RepID=A0A2A9G0K1_9PSEU|nr:hypothetical protein [Amycolatopsis sulphurea]PFG56948.1 hypothetical protein ATK36_0484 [Amycolatopsis sulphurea]